MKYNKPEWSYTIHHNNTGYSSEDDLPACYTNPNSINAWHHDRMKKNVMPLLKEYPEATWITIGDGCYGSDAYFLKCNGADVLATNINEHRLRIALEKGFITKFKAENAERISFSDNSFDFVFCKESYHHFPRPPIAFYEMLRIARRAVILIEPYETCRKKGLGYAKDLIKKIMRKQKSTLFEKSGNYIFRINIREIEKMMSSLNYEIIAIKRANSFFHPKLSDAQFATLSFPTLITKLGIAVQNVLCKFKMLDYGLATIIAFKQSPHNNFQLTLRHHGFKIIHLPKNPFLQAK